MPLEAGGKLWKTLAGPADQLRFQDGVPSGSDDPQYASGFDRLRQLEYVVVHYAAQVSLTSDVFLVAAGGQMVGGGQTPAVVLDAMVFSANNDQLYLPTRPIILGPEDNIEVLCPASANAPVWAMIVETIL
jgi:hypothetical protein